MKNDYSEKEIDKVLASSDDSKLKSIAPSLMEKAEQGNAEYANIISDWLYYGRFGLEKDIEKADFYLQIAVKALIPDAIYDYGLRSDGDTIEEGKKALSYFILAAVMGDTDAIDAISDKFLYDNDILGNNDFISSALRKHRYHLLDKSRYDK